ncbi:MAG: hypothetical protein KF865_13395 [Bdellovibrionaceae bacterium]|nr:hypothetical protein [Pseudobdellovibrionaceae bacterium]
MKKLLLIVSMFCIGLEAGASDQLRDEVVCNKVHRSGEADNGLTLILRGNETAWAKVVAVFENGYLGPRQIGNIQVPLQPEVSGGGRGYIPEVNLTYKGQGLVLSMRALRIKDFPLTGMGSAYLALPGYQPIQVSLICTRVN